MFVIKCMIDGNEVSSISMDGSKEKKTTFIGRFQPDDEGRMNFRERMMKNRWFSLADGEIIRIGHKRRKQNRPRVDIQLIECNVQEAENATEVPSVKSSNFISYVDGRENRSALSELNNLSKK